MRTKQTRRIGLALGSGAARGWVHIGILRALARLGVTPDVICGTSIGALIGGFYLSGHLAQLEEWARRLTKLRMIRYLDLGLARNGVVAGHRLFSEMEQILGTTAIEDLPAPFAAICTDLQTGHEVWLTKGSLTEAVRASFSLPGLFEPVYVDQRWLVDGAVVNPVPVSVCHALGAEVIIAVNLNTAPPWKNGNGANPAKEAGLFKPMPRWSGTVLRSARMRSAARRGAAPEAGPTPPSMLSVLASTLNIVQDRVTRSRLAAQPPDVNLVPKVGDIGLLEFHRAAEAIEAGEAVIDAAESEIRQAIEFFEATGS